MTKEEFLKLYPEFSIIGNNDYSLIILEKFNLEFDYNKSWKEIGLDDLDLIEMIMTLEKKFDFAISDLHIEYFFSLDHKPIDFKQYNRNKIIDKIIGS
jgi:acyl carrier protein